MRMSEQIQMHVGEMRQHGAMLNLMYRPTLLNNLVLMYQVITASENLMEVALEATTDGVLSKYLEHHRSEEKDHALWLKEDLRTAGIDVERVPLMQSALNLAGTQYYLIYHVSPNALLGYMAVLEGFPFPIGPLEQLEAVYGKDLLRCLRYHAVHDQEHRIELFEVIDKIGDPVILDNTFRTQYLLNEAVKSLC